MRRDSAPARTPARFGSRAARQVRTSLRRSVMDRILSEPGGSDVIRDELIRDLEWLLNTRCHLQVAGESFEHLDHSLYTYGLPDVGSFGTGPARTGSLIRSIRDAIEKFEPRLKNVAVAQEDKQIEPHVLGLIITGEVETDGSPQQVALKTRLDLSKGEYRFRGEHL
jgi:type VI secretion system protein ImpF